jgi:hypothetical protein
MPFTMAEIKLAAAGILLVALLSTIYWFANRERHQGAAAVDAKVTAALAQAQHSQAAELLQQATQTQKVLDAYQSERDAALAARDAALAAQPGATPPGRLPDHPLRGRTVPSTASTGPGAAEPPAAARDVPGVPGGAAGGCYERPELRDLAEASDALLALTRASQAQLRVDRNRGMP